MKKLRFLLLGLHITLILLYCSSCGFFGPQRYVCELDKVESIQIIKLDKYVEGEYRYEYTVLSKISDNTKFVNRLNDIEHSVNWGDPRQMKNGYVVVRIEYHNGDFDLLHSDAQCFNRSGVNNYGYFFFDDAQFNKLISDYSLEQV